MFYQNWKWWSLRQPLLNTCCLHWPTVSINLFIQLKYESLNFSLIWTSKHLFFYTANVHLCYKPKSDELYIIFLYLNCLYSYSYEALNYFNIKYSKVLIDNIVIIWDIYVTHLCRLSNYANVKMGILNKIYYIKLYNKHYSKN